MFVPRLLWRGALYWLSVFPGYLVLDGHPVNAWNADWTRPAALFASQDRRTGRQVRQKFFSLYLKLDAMGIQAPKYRVCTIEPVPKADVARAFAGELSVAPPDSSAWHCTDGTELVFHPSGESEQFFVEFRCQFRAEPTRAVNYGLLPKVIEFCQSHGRKLKVVRSGSVIAASGGVYSDVFRSQANRVAQHLALHPKDQKSIARFAKRDGV